MGVNIQIQDDVADMRSFIREFGEAFSRLTPVERAYRVIKSFLQCESPTDDMYGKFHGWLLDEHNREAKDRAWELIFEEECLPGMLCPPEVDIDDCFAILEARLRNSPVS
jgi:hypothetical protein